MMKERGKYSTQGMFGDAVFNRLNLPKEIKDILTSTANMAISSETKKKYSTALNNVEKCEQELQEKLSFPWDNRSTLIFIGWCIKRDLKTQSIRGYLSGISKVHLALGYNQLDTSTPIMKEIFNGHSNKHAQSNDSKRSKRQPCTLKMLKLLKNEIKCSNIPEKDKLMIWTCCTVSFYGALRPGEALSIFENYFDPSLTLCKNDVKIVKGKGEEKDAIHLDIKHSKTNKSGIAETIVIYSTSDMTCPVKAVSKLLNVNCNVSQSAPFFTNSDGKPLTQRKFNLLLRDLTKSISKHGVISGHSFRSGLISLFAKKGFSDESLKLIGRWSSRAFKVYIKMKRTARHEMAIACSNVKNC